MKKEENKQKINVIGWGKLPCLNCGEVIDLVNDIHFCNAKKLEWLNKQKDAVLILPNGKIFNFKEKKNGHTK